ncbi:AHH domain-containing protein [Zobellia nedashkovskayae]|uniref:AHH domain-containing protein n=1 Tax=Zobellia nedashkovskayae TaxID=2779510 RepID=UPI00188AD613|nr:AHH domain-containing protein [Zobellia nedashkovskayae]
MLNRAVKHMKNSMLRLQHFTKELVSDCGQLQTANFTLPTLLIRPLLLLVLLLNFFSASAQSFPVQVIPQATPPSPIYFSDYADASTISSPLRVQIILNDFEVANREIRLRTYFSGGGINFQSNDFVVGAEQLFLEGGTPLVLTNVQLAPYFRLENITGISPNVYGKAIPEGAYTFCFEVFDVLTGNRLSQRSCATSVVFHNDPPFLVSPRNKDNIAETNPQNIVFQWTPRHINVSNVEYELSIVEIWDTQVDPQQAFLSSPPVFSTTTSATTYVYGPADPLFLSGKNYAWRIQAKAKQGIEEIGLFENQGYSEIYSFSYATSCDLPIGISHEVKGSTNANIFWDDFSTDIPEYTLRYRQKNDPLSAAEGGNEWFMNKTTSNQTTLWDLKAGTVYEYQVQKQCAVTGSDWSITKQFTTFIADDEASVYECGITPEFDVSNKEPLPSINSGEQFTAGDFPINVLDVSGSNGRFTGKGYVTIPYLNSIRVGVEFTNILINTDKKLAEGTVTTMYDPSLKNILDIDEAINTVTDVVDATGEFFEGDNDLDEIEVDWAISKDDITIEDGKIVITNPYTGATKSEPLGDDMVITDSEGKTYYVDADGEITEGGVMDSGGAVTSGNVQGVSNDGQIESLTAQGILVTFDEEGTYGMDSMPSGSIGQLKQEYTIIKDADGDDYPLTHHAVKNGATTQIKADIDIQNSTYAASDVIFKNKQGEVIPHILNGTKATLTLTGRYTFENEVIYAVVPDKENNIKQLTAGAFTLWHLTERTVKVALVSVNGASLGSIETNVSNIFEKAVANIQFGDNLNLSVNKSELGANEQLDFGESAWAAAYNEEQKMLVNRVKQLSGYKSDTYYILVFNDIEPSSSIGGFMPLQRQMGFVFGGNPKEEDKDGDKSKTLAHEIGHGIFALQHPFTEYSINEDATEWLMDYGSGDQLPHTHWAQIHNPDLKFYIFQDEEDGEIAGRTWFTPDWTPFSIENSSIIRSKEESDRVKGTVPGFRLNNNVAYDARFKADGSFDGYYTEGNDNPYTLKLIPNIQDNASVYLFESVPNDCANTYLTDYAYVNSNKNSINFSSTNSNLLPVNITTNCETDLCEEGKKYFDSYKDLPTVEGSEEDYLRKVAELICEQGSDELIKAQKEQFKAWENSAKSITQNVQKSFSWENYYKALNSLNQWVSNDVQGLLTIEQRDELFEVAFRLEVEVLELLSLDKKLEMFKIMFDGELQKLFFPNHHEVIAKLTAAIKDEEATAFITALESAEYKVNEKPLLYHFKNRLSDYFTGDAYSDFFKEILRLSTVMATDSNLKIETPLIWDVEQKDYVLVSYVQNRNDYDVVYHENTFKVSVKKCISCCSGTRGCGSNKEYETLLDNVDPFHMIGLTILNDVSPLASGCAEDPRASEICGAMTPIPAIFLEYLGENETAQRWKNFGWNTFNVAITIGTLGEGAGAITAIRAAKDGTRVAIALKNSFKLFDFAYTVTDITLSFTESGPYGCGNLETEDDKEKCKEKWEEWKYVSYALAAKGGLDLTKGLAQSSAKVSRYSAEELREFIRATQLKKNNSDLNQDEIDEIITQLEDIIQRNGLQDEYQAALRGIDDVTDEGADLVSYVNNLMNKNIRNAILDVAESKAVAQKYFNRIQQNPSNYLSEYTLHLDDFDNWHKNVFQSNLFEAHHIIPKNVLRDNANLQSILDWARKNNKTWDFGDLENGIMLQKRRKNSLGEVVGDHANHPAYDEGITNKIDEIFNESNGNMSDAFDDFIDFVNDLKVELNSQVVEGDKVVNSLIIP